MHAHRLIIFLSVLLFISIISGFFSSCKVYYSVDDAKSQLSKAVSDAESNSVRLTTQIKSFLQQYHEMRCDPGNPVYAEAEQRAKKTVEGLDVMESYSVRIKETYTQFLNYSNGKSKIESGTPEWKSFKTTRNEIKSNAKLLQSKGEESIKSATQFHQFIEAKIVPSVSYCDVPNTLNQFQSAMEDLSRSQKKHIEEFKDFEKQVNNVIQPYQATYPDVCTKVSSMLKSMKTAGLGINKIKAGLLEETSAFRRSTQGMDKIYSCSGGWSAAVHAQQQLEKLKNELAGIEKSMQDFNAQILNEINQLK